MKEACRYKVEGLRQRKNITGTWISGFKNNPGDWDFYFDCMGHVAVDSGPSNENA